MSSNLDGDKTHYIRDLLSWETEGERSPAQDIEIRADFPRKQFCLYRNGEAVGVSSQYKAVWHAKQFLLAEMGVQP